ncbi:AbiH family protein [Bifidobacterium boum]
MRQTNRTSSENSATLPNFHSGNPWIDWYISNPSSKLCMFFLNELKEFETAFQEYIITNIQQHPSYYSLARNLYKTISSQYCKDSESGETRNAILSFNYTTPLPKCISEEQSTYQRRQLWVEQNVHGTLDSSCIFGIDGFDENNKRLEGIPRIFTKSNRQLYLERTGASTYPPNTSRTLFDAIRENGKIHCIKFYGHSLGAADYSYFRTIFNIVDIYNSDVTLYFLYSKNHPTNPEAVENLIDRYNRETLASTSANCDLLQKLLLEGRLQLRAIPDPTPDEC